MVIQGYTLSPQQQNYLTTWGTPTGKPAFLAVHCKGADKNTLRKALDKIFAEEAIFRTVYPVRDHACTMQVINDRIEVHISEHPETIEPEAISGFLAAYKRDITTIEPGAVQVAFQPVSDESYLGLIVLPGLAADLYTLSVFTKKWLNAVAEEPLTTDEDPIQYIQFAEWQQQLLTDEDTEESIKYWTQKEVSPSPTIAFDFDKEDNGKFEPARFDLTETYSSAELVKDSHTSTETVLITAFYHVLSRLTGGNLTLGYTDPLRDFEELEELCGVCAKTLPLTASWAAGWTMEDAILNIQTEIDECKLHKDGHQGNEGLPYGVEYYSAPGATFSKGSSRFTILDTETYTEPFRLKMVMKENCDRITVRFCYDKTHFSEDDIICLADSFRHVISQLKADKSQILASYRLMSPAWEEKVLKDFNRTEATFETEGKTISHAFADIVAEHGDRTAIIHQGTSYSYAWLNKMANKLATRLTNEHGIGTGDLVAIMTDKDAHLPAAMLAVSRCGAGFVPVDPSNPADRTQFVVNDSGVKALITTSAYNIANLRARSVLADEDTADEESNFKAPDRMPDDTLYVIYTSGTTGKPKGTEISDRSLLNYISWFKKQFSVTSSDSSILMGSYAFDLGYTAMWGTLLSGGTLHLVPDKLIRQPEELMAYVTDHQVSYLKITPSLLHALVQTTSFEKAGKGELRMILIGGEPIRPADLKRVAGKAPSVKLVNHYGPTEATIGTVAWEIDPAGLEAYSQRPVIGIPVANNRIYILDQQLNPVAPGEAGELMVSGKGLAKGYLGREALTAEKFIPNPFETGARLYRTGDVARWMTDGTILFEGRKDDQVKIRGYRVELKEVQSTLSARKGIDKAEVIAWKGSDFGPELAAYYTGMAKLDELRSELAELLPDYMQPSYYVRLERFPLTANGKVDKKALPDPSKSSGSVEMVPARNELDSKLLTLWTSVLDKEIGITDDFFTNGGHSLKAILLITRIQKELDYKIELHEIFIFNTVQKLSDHLDSSQKQTYRPIPAISKTPYYALSHAQHRLWILDQLEGDQIAYNMPGAFVLEGELDHKAFTTSFEYITSHHESLRTTFHTLDGEPWQKVHEPGELFLKMKVSDLRGHNMPLEQARMLAMKEAQTPFDLINGPLIRSHLFQTDDQQHVVVLNMHHIISDGWSFTVLIDELLRHYGDLKAGKPIEATAPAVQYKDFAAWQNDLLNSEEIKSSQSYWGDRFKGEIPVLNLPADHPRPAVQTFNGASHRLLLGADLLEKLNTLAKTNDATLYMVLMASVKALLYRYTGQEDIVIGTPIAGREHPDVEHIIGFFVNTLAIRSTFDESEGLGGILKTVKDRSLEAHTHQVYPFDRLIDDLNLERDLSRSALFDVMVSFSNPDSLKFSKYNLGGLSVKELSGEHTISKFDISFDFWETAEGLVMNIEYNTDIYAAYRIARMAGHFENLVRSAVENPEQPVHKLEMLSESEATQIRSTFNSTTVPFDQTYTILSIFEDQVMQTPGQPAVLFGETTLTYHSLNEQANQIAHYLIKKYSLGLDKRAGLMVGRSELTIPAVLGIMKTGAAYVPIDPEYPADRIQYLVQDSEIGLILTDKSTESLPETIDVLDLRTKWEEIATQSKNNPTQAI
ncbi:MAG: amino acid adenylation domain-containing protein, partial [Cyclobacteriaceae bacterium]